LAKVGNEEYRIVLGNQSSILYIVETLDYYSMTLVDKHAHSVWVNGQEVEVEVMIRVKISTMRFSNIQQIF